MTLGEKLVHLRKELGLSQLEAAEKLNVSRQAISRWEVGAAVPSVDNLRYLSELYGVPVDVLLDGGQDLLAWREGQQRREQEPPEAPPEPEHTAEPRPRGRRWAAAAVIGLLVLGLGVGILMGVWILPEESPAEVLPLDSTQHEDISSEAKDIFSFDENLDTVE